MAAFLYTAPTLPASGSVCEAYLQPTLQLHCNYTAYTLHFGLGWHYFPFSSAIELYYGPLYSNENILLGTLVVLLSKVGAQDWYSRNKVYSWTSAGITEVPSYNIPAEAVKVDLSWNQIAQIRRKSFSHLGVLEELDLWSNKIHTIENEAWDGLVSLKTLSLQYNQIEVIRENSFNHLSACEELNLYGNKIHTLENGAWNGLESLRELLLHENEIEVLQSGMFLGLTRCTELNVDNNKIHTIHSGAMEGMNSLTKLDLQYNMIHTIHSRALEPLKSLTELYLHSNQLSALSWTIFGSEHPPQLELSLDDNPLVCQNISLCWVKQGEPRHGWITWYHSSARYRPSYYHRPDCSDTNKDWDYVVLPCPPTGLYEQSVAVSCG